MKFRVWDLENKKFIDLHGDDCNQGESRQFSVDCDSRLMIFTCDHSSGYSYFPANYNSDKYKTMLSTGLFDKNGIEIYEGDSVKETTYYEDSDGSTERIIIVTNYTEYLFNLRLEGDYWKSDLEVIGNVYRGKNEAN